MGEFHLDCTNLSQQLKGRDGCPKTPFHFVLLWLFIMLVGLPLMVIKR